MRILRRRNGADVRKHLTACRDDLVALQRDARNLANGVGDVTRDSATRAARQASDVLDVVSTRLNGVSKSLNGYSNGNSGSVLRFARSRPMATIAVLAGAGAVLGALLSRRD